MNEDPRHTQETETRPAYQRDLGRRCGGHPVRPPDGGGAPAPARDRACVRRRRQYLRLLARADGPRAPGARHLVPASLHRRSERGHAPAPPYRAGARARSAARLVRQRAGRGGRERHPAAGDRGSLAVFAHPAGDYGASHRVEARHGAGEVPQDLSPLARARRRAMDGAGAPDAARRHPRPDRARVDDRRAPSGEADGRARGLTRAPFLRRDAVREGAGDDGAARRCACPLLPERAFRAAALLPVRLVDRRRPRRQSSRHHGA